MFEKNLFVKRIYLFSALQVQAVTISSIKEVPLSGLIYRAVALAASLFCPQVQRTYIFSVSKWALFGSIPCELKVLASFALAAFAAFLYVGSVVCMFQSFEIYQG